MRILFFSLFALLALTTPSRAQPSPNDLGAATQRFHAACMRNMGGAAECACVAGFFGGRMPADEYQMVSVIEPFIDRDGNIADMPGAVRASQAERQRQGMTQERYMEIMQHFSNIGTDGPLGDRICGVLGTHPPAADAPK